MKKLTPLPNTLYYRSYVTKKFTIHNDETISHNKAVTWQAEIHVYVTGNIKPDAPDFEGKGEIHVVVCHTGTVTYASRTSGEIYFSCGLDDLDALPYVHLPITGSLTRQGTTHTYKFDFKKTFQMARSHKPQSFEAQYSHEFALANNTEYHTDLDLAALQVKFMLWQRSSSDNNTYHALHGISGFRLTKPREKITLWFYADQTTKDVKTVTISLKF
ncbi:hypothetical protein AB1N83_011082 [Pleurotus pulmonarius]